MPHRPYLSLAAIAVALLAMVSAPLTARATLPMRDGSLPSEVRGAVASGLLAAPLRPALGTTAVQGHPVWVVPVILVDFTDQPLSALSTPAAWERALFDTTHSTATGSAYDYYQWVSRGQFRLVGRVVAVVHLSQDKHYYANNAYGLASMATPNNDYGAVSEAVNLCDGAVDFSPYDQDHDGYVDMLWVIHSGIGGEATVDKNNLYSVTSSMDQWSNANVFVTNDPVPNGGGQKIRINRFSILPELSQFHAGQLSEIGVYCHEFGHALGLPDLYDTSGGRNFGPGNFSLMSTGAYGGDGQSPESPPTWARGRRSTWAGCPRSPRRPTPRCRSGASRTAARW
jgi:immune inhibitor A